MQKSMSRLRSGLLIGGGMIMAGSAITKFMGQAVSLAADVELSMTRLQSLTQGNAAQMAEFARQTQNAAHQTAIFSQVQAAELGVTIEQSTKMSIDAINKTLPAFAMFAEAQQKLHGTSATAAVTAAGQMAKTMGLSPSEIPAFLEKLHRVSAAMPKTAQLPSLARDVNRPLAFLKGIGANRAQQDELIQLQAMLTSMGGGGATFGGRNLLMAMTRTISPTAGGVEAQKRLGITGRDEQGRFDVRRFEEQLATVHQRHPEIKQAEFVHLMKSLFGQNALALAMRLSAPDIGKRKTEFRAAEARVDPIQTFVNKFLNTFAGAKTQLITDFASAMAEFGKHLLPVLTPLLHFLDGLVVSATKFMEAHPGLTKMIAVLTALGGAGLIAGGVAVILGSVVTFIASVSEFLPIIGAIAAGFALVVAQGALLAAFFKKHPQEWAKLKMDMAQIMGELKKIFIEMKPVISEAAKVLKPLVEIWFQQLVTQLDLLLKGIQLFIKGIQFEMSGGISGHFVDWVKGKLGGKGTPPPQMGPPAPSSQHAGIGLVKGKLGYHQPGAISGNSPGIYHNQVAGIGLVKIHIEGSKDPKQVAKEVLSVLTPYIRQGAKGSGNVEEMAFATPYMYT